MLSSVASLCRFLMDFGRDSRVARFVTDLDFFGLTGEVSFAFEILAGSLTGLALSETLAKVLLMGEERPAKQNTPDFFGGLGSWWSCWFCWSSSKARAC